MKMIDKKSVAARASLQNFFAAGFATFQTTHQRAACLPSLRQRQRAFGVYPNCETNESDSCMI
jgi:hypothetical protein